MVELYGGAFLSAYGDRPSPIWLAAIGGLTDDECRKGFTTLAGTPREYPANLTQFVGACKYREPVRYLGVPMSARELAALNGEGCSDPEVAREWLEHLRGMVGPVQATESEVSRSSSRYFSPPCTCQATGVCRVCRDWAVRIEEAEKAGRA